MFIAALLNVAFCAFATYAAFGLTASCLYVTMFVLVATFAALVEVTAKGKR